MPELRHIYAFAGFDVDTARFEVRHHGSPISLTRKEFELLVLLADQAPAAVTKDEILSRVWAETAVEEGTLTKTISRLRSSLGPTGGSLIATVTGIGYRLDAPVERRVPPAPVSVPVTPVEPLPATATIRHQTIWPRVAAGALLAAVALGVWWITRPAPMVTPPGPALSLTGWFGDVAIAPSGPLVAVVRRESPEGPGAVEVYRDDGALPIWRDPDGPSSTGLAWSADGRRLGYTRVTAAGRLWVTVVSPATDPVVTVRPLPPPLASATSFAWRSDTHVVAAGLPDAGLTEWSLSDDGVRVLTHPPRGAADTLPALSPTGEQLAFVRVGAGGEGEVYVVSIAGGDERSLTDDDGVVSGLTWTRDGRAIVFGSTRAGRASGGLWRVAATGGAVEAVAPDVTRAAVPAQHHDHLAFAERYREANLYVRQDAAPWQRLFDSPDDEHSPTLSPDGTRVAFISSRSGSEEVWVGALDAAVPTAITAIGGAGVGTPRWSPDGRWIAFDATSAGDGNIYVIAAGGGAPRQITRTPSHDVLPAWSADGRWLYFRSHRDAAARLYRIPMTDAGPAAGATPELVADETIWEAQEGGTSLAFIRQLDGRGLFQRPVNGGSARLIPGTGNVVPWRAWTVAGDRAYLTADTSPGVVTLLEIALAGAQPPRAIWEGPWSRLRGYPSLAVSVDGTRIVLARADERLRIHRRY